MTCLSPGCKSVGQIWDFWLCKRHMHNAAIQVKFGTNKHNVGLLLRTKLHLNTPESIFLLKLWNCAYIGLRLGPNYSRRVKRQNWQILTKHDEQGMTFDLQFAENVIFVSSSNWLRSGLAHSKPWWRHWRMQTISQGVSVERGAVLNMYPLLACWLNIS